MNYKMINKAVGNMDLFLMDQLLKGRFENGVKILDAGCGEGRNLFYFINNDYDVYGIDRNPGAIQMLRYVAKTKNKNIDAERFQIGNIEHLPYPDNFFDLIMCISVLHFSDDLKQYYRMLSEISRVLKKEGILFVRMDSLIGLSESFAQVDGGKYVLQDGTLRFFADYDLMEETNRRCGLEWLEPFRVVLEQGRPGVTVQLMKKIE
jgi:SAM-dependent methyltransferase